MRTAILFSLHHFSCRVGARPRACSTSSIGFNLCENCYTCSIFISPTARSAYRIKCTIFIATRRACVHGYEPTFPLLALWHLR